MFECNTDNAEDYLNEHAGSSFDISRLALLSTVSTAGFLTALNAERIPGTTHDLIPHPFQWRNYIDIFKEGVHSKDAELENFGTGDGRDFQKLSKECPFFAVEFAAIGLRNIRKHWGPINRRAAEVKGDADIMFKEVQKLVDQDKLGPLL